MGTQDMVVFDVEKIATYQDEWNVSFGPGDNDPWMTVTRDQIGREPNKGDIITVQLPVALSIRTPSEIAGLVVVVDTEN
jgi:hypothetical protein